MLTSSDLHELTRHRDENSKRLQVPEKDKREVLSRAISLSFQISHVREPGPGLVTGFSPTPLLSASPGHHVPSQITLSASLL